MNLDLKLEYHRFTWPHGGQSEAQSILVRGNDFYSASIVRNYLSEKIKHVLRTRLPFQMITFTRTTTYITSPFLRCRQKLKGCTGCTAIQTTMVIDGVENRWILWRNFSINLPKEQLVSNTRKYSQDKLWLNHRLLKPTLRRTFNPISNAAEISEKLGCICLLN